MSAPVLCTHRRDIDGARCVLNADHVERRGMLALHGYARPDPNPELVGVVRALEREPATLIAQEQAAALIRAAMGWTT